jgi:LAO/AO transport system kinase
MSIIYLFSFHQYFDFYNFKFIKKNSAMGKMVNKSHINPAASSNNNTDKPIGQGKMQGGRKKPQITLSEYFQGVRNGNRALLGRALTLIESNAPHHQKLAQDLLTRLLPFTGSSVRIGISGPPGVGKSTFIESFGLHLIRQAHKVAVLTIDPSSTISRGSILGDKTRMEQLSKNANAFVRPSPSGGTLGGVTRKTRESILVCEAAGYDIILIETVGIGQSEIDVRHMVDCLILLQIAGAGDELQGIKKGIVEIADIIVVNKAESKNRQRAEVTQKELEIALNYLTPYTQGWQPPVLLASALNGSGIKEVWDMVEKFINFTKSNGFFIRQRMEQSLHWFRQLTELMMQQFFMQQPHVAEQVSHFEQMVVEGKLPPLKAAEEVINILRKQFKIQ